MISINADCENFVRIEGHVDRIKSYVSEKGKKELSFLLYSVNSNEDDLFITTVKVVCRNKSAEIVKDFLQTNMCVKVEGILRIQKGGRVEIISTFVRPSAPHWIDVEDDRFTKSKEVEKVWEDFTKGA